MNRHKTPALADEIRNTPPPPKHPSVTSLIINGKTIKLPAFGEVKIVCHDGKVKTIETTVKEKIE